MSRPTAAIISSVFASQSFGGGGADDAVVAVIVEEAGLITP